jgi:hypothetical protein
MSEHRRPAFTLRIRANGQTHSDRVDFFHASDWEGYLKGRPVEGLYRLRLNGCWFCPDIRANEKIFLCDYATAMAHLAKTVLELPSELPGDQLPDEALYQAGTRVRVKLADETVMATYPLGKPFQDPSGAWRIALVGGRLCRNNPAYVHEVEIVK